MASHPGGYSDIIFIIFTIYMFSLVQDLLLPVFYIFMNIFSSEWLSKLCLCLFSRVAKINSQFSVKMPLLLGFFKDGNFKDGIKEILCYITKYIACQVLGEIFINLVGHIHIIAA